MLYFYLPLFPGAGGLSEVSSIHDPKKSLAFEIAVGCIKPFVVYFI